MRPDEARRFLERVYDTHEHELDCAGLMEVVDRYVEVEARGEDASRIAPDVPHHLFICADCAELVATLTQLVELEESGELPQIDELWSELEEASTPRRSARGPFGRFGASSFVTRVIRVFRPSTGDFG